MILETDTNNTKSSAVNDSGVAPLIIRLLHFLTYTVEQRR